ncbi:YagK/YfjJ domain-containing protein [Klebsiella michiganensis]|uniref:YagK/YfjJ domain-containing protein n=1 Tax=Klebsiella/Raoultella group TaxID=2890311 RepID=UPI0029CAB8F2|nr:inovirus-type Gp2 protein [Raoultella ornithinolytica]WPJ14188.1 inovirus-type Gp2 protein [Raoultella ornithinolytica]
MSVDLLSTSVQKITNHRDDGRYSLIHSSEYVLDGLVYRLNYGPSKKGYHPIRKEIIDAFIKQLQAMQSHYSKIFAFRFDLSVPEGMSVSESNVLVSDLFERLRGRFKKKAWNGQPIKKFAYGWVREKEVAMQVHYHCWIALPHFQVQTAGFGNTGMIGLISELWDELTNDISRVHLASNGHYDIARDDHDALVDFVERISYLAKNSGKFSSGEGQRIFSTSKVRMKESN